MGPGFERPLGQLPPFAMRHPEVFVHNYQGKTYCPDCIPEELKPRLGEPEVKTWRTYEGGWKEPLVCSVCSLSIPIYVDGNTCSHDGEDPSLCGACGSPVIQLGVLGSRLHLRCTYCGLQTSIQNPWSDDGS